MNTVETLPNNLPPLQYPVSINLPNERTYSKEVDGALFDAEYFGEHLDRMRFFERPVGREYAFVGGRTDCPTKTCEDTNIVSSKMLDYPIEFLVQDIGVFISGPLTELREHLIARGRIRLVVRSSEYKDAVARSLEWAVSEFPSQFKEGGTNMTKICRPPAESMLPLNPFRLLPMEEFFVELKCPYLPPRSSVSCDLRIKVILGGKRFAPLVG